MNRISLIYPRTSWRPTYYLFVDHAARDKDWRPYIEANLGAKRLWLLDEYRTGLPEGADGYEYLSEKNALGEVKNVTWLKRCPRHIGYSGGNPKSMQEWHFPEICVSLNSISSMIQISVQLGYDEIYMLGCDLDYKIDLKQNHFDPNYSHGIEPTNIRDAAYWISADEYNATKAHKIAKSECAARGVKIYNATVGGSLEVYERVDINKLLKG